MQEDVPFATPFCHAHIGGPSGRYAQKRKQEAEPTNIKSASSQTTELSAPAQLRTPPADRAMMQTWEEHVEVHVYLTRDRLDELAWQHIAVGAEPLSTAALLTLTADEIDYLYARIASSLETQLIRAGGLE